MLEIKNLSKTYKPKKGVPVQALCGINLSLPETGMVFLLGKSGSGKSTLLNLLGGLDSYDSGDMVISGTSTAKFRQSDFDSYRNTLVGFIFQEYNILDDFTVGANIALALELQGKKATDEDVNRILSQVDLLGYGARRPNELSGGQKQRVAIARALVKNPKIILADEPTGALDSVTGRQILDTLKMLSREKLVIVVSHDREFALRYADRIVELADGKIISDREYFQEDTGSPGKGGLSFRDDTITLSSGYRLTEEDRCRINAYLDALREGRDLSIRVSEGGKRQSRETVLPEKQNTRSPFRFIASRLPMKVAFRIGAGALKHKKIRLAFTILLSCVAFGLFGLSDTFSAYDHVTTCVRSIIDSNIHYAAVIRTEKYVYSPEGDYYFRGGDKMKEEELEQIREETGVAMEGVFCPYNADLVFDKTYNTNAQFTQTQFHIYPYGFNGFAEVNEDFLEQMNMPLLVGRLPQGNKNELLISSYICETFYIGGFAKTGPGDKVEYETIAHPQDMLGRQITLNGESYTVVGVVDCDFDLERYRPLTQLNEDQSTADLIVDYALYQELVGIRNHSLVQVAMVGEGHLKPMLEEEPDFYPVQNGFMNVEWSEKIGNDEHYFGLNADRLGTLSDKGKYEIAWTDGEITKLEENQIVISLESILDAIGFQSQNPNAYDEKGKLLYSKLTKEEKDRLLSQAASLGPMEIYCSGNWDNDGKGVQVKNVHIVGVLLPDDSGFLPELGQVILAHEKLVSPLVNLDDGTFNYAVGRMPENEEDVRRLVSFSTREDSDVRYELQNPVVFELDAIHELLGVLAKAFLYVGIGFAVFASLMLANFIGTSIVYKKEQIGILRAIGARSNDVFRIFFSESFVIAMINFVLSALGTFSAVQLINHFVRTETGILITVLNFSVRQWFLLFGVSVLVAAWGSFLPVKKAASKEPLDAIRGR